MRSIDKLIDKWAAEAPDAGRAFFVKLKPGEEVSFVQDGYMFVKAWREDSSIWNVTDAVNKRRCQR